MQTFDPKYTYDNVYNSDIPAWLCSTIDLPPNTFVVPPHKRQVLLINANNQISSLSNICTHKQSIIYTENRGALGSVISCPIHRWTWNTTGELRKAPGFEKHPLMDLQKSSIYTWNGHIFTGSQNWLKDVSKLGDKTDFLKLENHIHHSHQALEYNFSWQIFMEIFLDLYHVNSFHPGLRSLTDCSKFNWAFGENWQVQTGEFLRQQPVNKDYSVLYDYYHQTNLYKTAKFGAIWLLIYPNIMIEYYPGCIVVSTVWPNGKNKCLNYLDFYYEKSILEEFPDFATAMINCFMVTANEDEEIGLRMQEGRNLSKNQLPLFNHPSQEVGYMPFFTWLQNQTQQNIN